ncbi:hypothetical protein SAMN05192562_11017 [Kosakonia arachidis]|uniref:Uncharacterized protein n=1 Tax=Kosakonia arachidis TaxID=551989 RepID=A0A1I7E518_9ENTR|nr:hypothetical protein SAMN05192562_11017 [Kosakonia arachidis]
MMGIDVTKLIGQKFSERQAVAGQVISLETTSIQYKQAR